MSALVFKYTPIKLNISKIPKVNEFDDYFDLGFDSVESAFGCTGYDSTGTAFGCTDFFNVYSMTYRNAILPKREKRPMRDYNRMLSYLKEYVLDMSDFVTGFEEVRGTYNSLFVPCNAVCYSAKSYLRNSFFRRKNTCLYAYTQKQAYNLLKRCVKNPKFIHWVMSEYKEGDIIAILW